jgi:hypothetical protein
MRFQLPRAFVAAVLLTLGAVQTGSAQSREDFEKMRKEIDQLK